MDSRLGPRLPRSEFRRFVELNTALDHACPDERRRAAARAILAATDEALAGPSSLSARLPGIIGRAMQPFGWLWNGIYRLREDGKLHLGPAHGPPVCSELERSGGPLSSGMCFDALLMNQTLAAYDAKAWPGYLSCDAESGLQTVSGIVCPIRDTEGRAVGVWDLDATERVEPIDVRFMDVLFATLARCEGAELALGP